MTRFSRVDFSVPPAQRAGFSLPDELEVNLENALKPITPLVREVGRTLLHTSRLYWPGIEDRARTSIFNHAINDFTSLLSQLEDGDGRNAARTSRSLYEHLVNYCWVAAYEEARERYITHEVVTRDLMAKMRRGVMLLSSVQRKRELHRLKGIGRKNEKAFREALKKYGSSFTRDWSAVSLRERAEICGFESSYDTYRLLSQVTHGSFGGTLGTRREDNDIPVHRVGSSLELAIISYPEGLSFFRDLCRRIHVLDGLDTSELVDAINLMIGAWPAYKAACEAVDRHLWPTSPPQKPTAVLAFYPNGGKRWFLWEPDFAVIAPAPPPEKADDWAAQAWEQLGLVNSNTFAGLKPWVPITIAIHGIRLTVDTHVKWYPAESIMEMPTDH
ncbi:DUF5677 domain-containing protein [Streptomyces sp. NBC_01235]|uniref:DUF5677 domain-containing protein n=1 Tax=Streptomyces sp. NBC_01235 TaxID=2903788 RepID=UPI002E0F8514|nr:DUF5677 domain-containing protein [Streptomyces sp. NBC_01235]